jgi:hypothetical protein
MIAAAAAYIARDLLWRLLFRVVKYAALALSGAAILLTSCMTFGGAGLVATRQFGAATTPVNPPIVGPGNPIVPVPPDTTLVTDLQRYLLAIAAGWRDETAIEAVAISIAEDPAGDPAVISPTRDLGLWQINELWWPQFGGRDALSVPQTNANAAFWIYSNARTVDGILQHWNSWSTFRRGTHLQYMTRARAAAALAGVPAVGVYTFPLPGWRGPINVHWGVATAIGGSDLFAPSGTPVVSVSAGSVTSAGWEPIGGNNVLIKGADGLLYYYAHFVSEPMVRTGQTVAAGTPIGLVGNTGDADRGAPHLHIGIGYWIMLGADAFGGTGGGFDAVSFLRQIYAAQNGG